MKYVIGSIIIPTLKIRKLRTDGFRGLLMVWQENGITKPKTMELCECRILSFYTPGYAISFHL